MSKTPKRRLIKGVLVFYPITKEEVDAFWDFIARRNHEGLKAMKKHQSRPRKRK